MKKIAILLVVGTAAALSGCCEVAWYANKFGRKTPEPCIERLGTFGCGVYDTNGGGD